MRADLTFSQLRSPVSAFEWATRSLNGTAPVSGSRIATPPRTEADLRTVLTQLCPAEHLGKSNIKEFHGRLGIMIGQWSAEQARLDISPW
jgi:hypothetical protein